MIDGRRGEVFWSLYEAVPGGVVRGDRARGRQARHLIAELQAVAGDVHAWGDGAILYRHEIERELGGRVEFASATHAHPQAAQLVELAAPRFLREEHDRLFDVVRCI